MPGPLLCTFQTLQQGDRSIQYDLSEARTFFGLWFSPRQGSCVYSHGHTIAFFLSLLSRQINPDKSVSLFQASHASLLYFCFPFPTPLSRELSRWVRPRPSVQIWLSISPPQPRENWMCWFQDSDSSSRKEREVSLQLPAGAVCSKAGGTSLGYWVLLQILRMWNFDLYSAIILCMSFTCREYHKVKMCRPQWVWFGTWTSVCFNTPGDDSKEQTESRRASAKGGH